MTATVCFVKHRKKHQWWHFHVLKWNFPTWSWFEWAQVLNSSLRKHTQKQSCWCEAGKYAIFWEHRWFRNYSRSTYVGTIVPYECNATSAIYIAAKLVLIYSHSTGEWYVLLENYNAKHTHFEYKFQLMSFFIEYLKFVTTFL